MVILRAGRVDLGKERAARIDVLAGRGADGGTVVVLRDDFAAGEDVVGQCRKGSLVEEPCGAHSDYW